MNKLLDWMYQPFAAYPDKTERLVYFLIFLFPIAGMSVRHWITNIFNLLVLISLFTLRKPQEPLRKEEKVFLWICAAYFFMFLISSYTNGWDKAQTYYLGTEIRFLFVIPLYLLLRRYPNSTRWLSYGAIVAGYFLISQACYDIYILEARTALGVYSKNIIGPFSVITGFWALHYLWTNYKNLQLIPLAIIAFSILSSFVTVAMSGSRGAYVGFIITGFVFIFITSKPRWAVAGFLVICSSVFLLYQNSDTVKDRVNVATKNIQDYYQTEDHVESLSSTTSTGTRLEMIRTSIFLIEESPIFGIGPGNYNKTIIKYIDQGKVSPFLKGYKFPHNAFIEAATAKGLAGLITLLLLLYYPVYIYIKGYNKSAALGLIHIAAISAFSLTDHSVIVMNNYSSIFLLGMTIFLSSFISQEYNKKL